MPKLNSLREMAAGNAAEVETEKRDLLEKAESVENIEPGDLEKNHSVTVKQAEHIVYPLDKVNSNIWTMPADWYGGKRIKLEVEKKDGKKRNRKKIYIYCTIGSGTDKRTLNAFDWRVSIAIFALFSAGNEITTKTQIYEKMGHTAEPNSDYLKKIDDSIAKMSTMEYFIDNREEIEAGYKYKYKDFTNKGIILPVRRGPGIFNGKLTDGAIHIIKAPPLIVFAVGRKQYTTLDLKIFQSPVNKTDGNLLIEDYLITRIARAKNGAGPSKIKFDAIREKTKTEKVRKRRLMDTIRRYLDHYKECEFISWYRIGADGITVYFAKKSAK